MRLTATHILAVTMMILAHWISTGSSLISKSCSTNPIDKRNNLKFGGGADAMCGNMIDVFCETNETVCIKWTRNETAKLEEDMQKVKPSTEVIRDCYGDMSHNRSVPTDAIVDGKCHTEALPQIDGTIEKCLCHADVCNNVDQRVGGAVVISLIVLVSFSRLVNDYS